MGWFRSAQDSPREGNLLQGFPIEKELGFDDLFPRPGAHRAAHHQLQERIFQGRGLHYDVGGYRKSTEPPSGCVTGTMDERLAESLLIMSWDSVAMPGEN